MVGRFWGRLVFGAVALSTLAACGGGTSLPNVSPTASTVAPTESTASPDTAAGSDTTAASSSGAISDKADVVNATVRIVASGSFRDISEGQQAADWSGSGFIISPEGLVVTNQHVVEGAGSLEVYLNGEDRPKNAKILGVSECNDLAVIDLEGDGYPYLDWYQGETKPGLDVWVAGFPLGDPEFTLTRGSISKAEANGETSWASLDYSLEHDARQEPGNSGGPLVDEKGQVVGVNYSGGDIGGTGVEHFFSIPTALATPVIDVLKDGTDQDSVGINGTAFYDEASGLAGIWVNGVRAGSPASDLNIKPGDVVTDLGGRQMITPADLKRDGFATKAGYCDVLRTQGTDRAIAIRVVRFDTGEILTGELNNPDRPLELEATIAGEVTGDTTPGAAPADTEYDSVIDDTGALWVDVPSAWNDHDTAGMAVGSDTWPAVQASTDLAAFNGGWDEPGIMVAIASGITEADIETTLDSLAPQECTFDSRNDYGTDYLTGKFDVYTKCGNNGGTAVLGVFKDVYSEKMILVAALASQDSDLSAIDHALTSLYISSN